MGLVVSRDRSMTVASLVQPAPLGGSLQVSVSAEGTATVVAFQGEADVATVAALVDTLAQVSAHGEGDVVVDLSRIEFMDTAALRAVLAAKATLAGDGRQLTLRSPSRIAGRLLGVFGLGHLVSPPAATRR